MLKPPRLASNSGSFRTPSRWMDLHEEASRASTSSSSQYKVRKACSFPPCQISLCSISQPYVTPMPPPFSNNRKFVADSPTTTMPHHGSPFGHTTRQDINKGSRYAYVTLFSQDSYVQGIEALSRSARVVGLKYPLIVMITNGVSPAAEERVKKEGCVVKKVQPFLPPEIDHSKYSRALYAECWNKLRMWQMDDEYDRLIYLDADMVLMRNIDHLFSLPPAPLYAVGDCYGGRHEPEIRDACCFFEPDATPEYFNAGFYMMNPSRRVWEDMMVAIKEKRHPVGKLSEQDWLNGYFRGRWRHLSHNFNFQKRIRYHHPDIYNLHEIAIFHYVDEKPWSHRHSDENLNFREEVDYWWAVYEGKLGAPAANTTIVIPNAVSMMNKAASLGMPRAMSAGLDASEAKQAREAGGAKKKKSKLARKGTVEVARA